MSSNICITCGKEIPEGRMVCSECETGQTKTIHRCKTKYKQYQLILYDDGDIEIINYAGRRVYHKSYNVGDIIEKNLIEAYHRWVDLCRDAYWQKGEG